MQFLLISDNHDTIMGMRLAGIQGVIAETKESAESALIEATKNENIGIVLLTNKLCNLCADLVDSYRLNNSRPLIVEIPDRHGDIGGDNSILRCIRDAVGIKF